MSGNTFGIPGLGSGTPNAALASVLGALNDTASADDPTTADTAIQYLKQIINILEGTAGIAGWTASAAPGNGVSLHEVIRKIYDDVTLALADTNELQGDWVNGGRLDLLIDAVLADTNELQGDWANGGRLDLLIDAILADTGTDGVVLGTRTTANSRLEGVAQVKEFSITAAANAGVTTVATITTQPCVIEKIILHSDGSTTSDLTSAAIKGGASQVVTFISAASAAKANVDAADEQVAWDGAARFAASKTIAIDLQGTGTTAVDFTVTIAYVAAVSGGYLA
jgi:hypothetical protein